MVHDAHAIDADIYVWNYQALSMVQLIEYDSDDNVYDLFGDINVKACDIYDLLLT